MHLPPFLEIRLQPVAGPPVTVAVWQVRSDQAVQIGPNPGQPGQSYMKALEIMIAQQPDQASPAP